MGRCISQPSSNVSPPTNTYSMSNNNQNKVSPIHKHNEHDVTYRQQVPVKKSENIQNTHPQIVSPDRELNTDNVIIGDRRNFMIWGFIRINIEETKQFKFNKIIPNVLKKLCMDYLGNYMFISEYCNILEQQNGNQIIISNDIENKEKYSTIANRKTKYTKLVSLRALPNEQHSVEITIKLNNGYDLINNVCCGIVSSPKGFLLDEIDDKHIPFQNKECDTSYCWYNENLSGFNDGMIINSRVLPLLSFSDKFKEITIKIVNGFELKVPVHNMSPIDMFKYRQYFFAMAFMYEPCKINEFDRLDIEVTIKECMRF